MITAVDTSVLLDVFAGDARFGRASAAALRACRREGRLIASDVVWAETASFFDTPEAASAAMARVAVEFVPLSEEAALEAATTWKAYRAGGGGRDRVVADFLIAAHARAHADRLLTRDRGFYRAWFAALPVLDPTAGLPG